MSEEVADMKEDPMCQYVERLRSIGITEQLAVCCSNGQIDDRRYCTWYVHIGPVCESFDMWERAEQFATHYVAAREAAKTSMLEALS